MVDGAREGEARGLPSAQKRWSLPCPHCRAPLDLPDPERVQGRDYRVVCLGPPERVGPLDVMEGEACPLMATRVAHIAIFERAMWAEPGGIVRWVWKVGRNT